MSSRRIVFLAVVNLRQADLTIACKLIARITFRANSLSACKIRLLIELTFIDVLKTGALIAGDMEVSGTCVADHEIISVGKSLFILTVVDASEAFFAVGRFSETNSTTITGKTSAEN